jgi:hypothetical protein
MSDNVTEFGSPHANLVLIVRCKFLTVMFIITLSGMSRHLFWLIGINFSVGTCCTPLSKYFGFHLRNEMASHSRRQQYHI